MTAKKRRSKFIRPRLPGINGPLGRYVIRISKEGIYAESQPDSAQSTPRDPFRLKGQLSPLKPLTNHLMTLKRSSGGEMRLINFEFRSMDQDTDQQKDKLPPITTTLTFSDFLCKWCLTYVGQRRQFCSADCAAQFKLCQRRREEKQNLNISVDYYGNVKLSIQGLPLNASEGIEVTKSYAGGGGAGLSGGGGVIRRGRRRKRCRNCAKLLKSDSEQEFCDETCQNMDSEKNKREDFGNVFQQKEIAERRRIRKWLLDAQDQYTKQQGDGPDPYIIGESLRLDADVLDGITSGPADLNPLPVSRTPLLPDIHKKSKEPLPTITSGPAELNPLPISRTPFLPEILNKSKDSQSRSGGPANFSRRYHFVQQPRYRLNRDEVITGGPVTLNPIPLRRGQLRTDRNRHGMDSDKRQVMIDLKWIPKFHG